MSWDMKSQMKILLLQIHSPNPSSLTHAPHQVSPGSDLACVTWHDPAPLQSSAFRRGDNALKCFLQPCWPFVNPPSCTSVTTEIWTNNSSISNALISLIHSLMDFEFFFYIFPLFRLLLNIMSISSLFINSFLGSFPACPFAHPLFSFCVNLLVHVCFCLVTF